jgi:hypothetical protein
LCSCCAGLTCVGRTAAPVTANMIVGVAPSLLRFQANCFNSRHQSGNPITIRRTEFVVSLLNQRAVAIHRFVVGMDQAELLFAVRHLFSFSGWIGKRRRCDAACFESSVVKMRRLRRAKWSLNSGTRKPLQSRLTPAVVLSGTCELAVDHRDDTLERPVLSDLHKQHRQFGLNTHSSDAACAVASKVCSTSRQSCVFCSRFERAAHGRARPLPHKVRFSGNPFCVARRLSL